jgi:hypothetical protein
VAAAAPAADPVAAKEAPLPKRQVSCKDLAAMKSLVSEEWSGWSNEFLVSQEIINQFARSRATTTGSTPTRCAPRPRALSAPPSPTACWCRSLASRLRMPMDFEVTDFGNMVNYGSDRLRFRRAIVPSGCRIHGRCRVKAVEQVEEPVCRSRWRSRSMSSARTARRC